jgi:hypothetical protein
MGMFGNYVHDELEQTQAKVFKISIAVVMFSPESELSIQLNLLFSTESEVSISEIYYF